MLTETTLPPESSSDNPETSIERMGDPQVVFRRLIITETANSVTVEWTAWADGTLFHGSLNGKPQDYSSVVVKSPQPSSAPPLPSEPAPKPANVDVLPVIREPVYLPDSDYCQLSEGDEIHLRLSGGKITLFVIQNGVIVEAYLPASLPEIIELLPVFFGFSPAQWAQAASQTVIKDRLYFRSKDYFLLGDGDEIQLLSESGNIVVFVLQKGAVKESYIGASLPAVLQLLPVFFDLSRLVVRPESVRQS